MYGYDPEGSLRAYSCYLVAPPEGSKGDRKALGRPGWGETHTNVTDIQYSPGKARNDKVQLFASDFAPAVSD